MAIPALALAVGGGLVKGGANAYLKKGMASDLELTEEQLRKLRELERLEALDAFGFDKGERDLYRQQLLTPVQQAENEALARFGASQNIEDIGQGSAFRQQQALKQTSEAARAETARAVAQRDAEIARQQQDTLMRMRQQEMKRKQLEREAVASMLDATGDAIGTFALDKSRKEDEAKLLSNLKGASLATVMGTANMLGVPGLTPGVTTLYKATDQSLGQSGPVAVENGVIPPGSPLASTTFGADVSPAIQSAMEQIFLQSSAPSQQDISTEELVKMILANPEVLKLYGK